MAEKRIGIIGGSGLYTMKGVVNMHRERVETPFGNPSDELEIGELEGREVVFLPRHGRGHRILPSEINYRANIWAMKKMGVEWIISVSAVGSFKKEIKPLDIVLVDQFVDRTKRSRETTFFGDGIAAHIIFAQPVCYELSKILYETGRKETKYGNVHWGGTYLNMEGPAFSTKAESLLYKSWGMDVIGMTNMSEAKLAREAEICFATMAMVTDYDCWIEGESEAVVSVDVVVENFNKNIETVKEIIRRAIPQIPKERNCACASALKSAMITRPDRVPKKVLQRLDLILGKYIQ